MNGDRYQTMEARRTPGEEPFVSWCLGGKFGFLHSPPRHQDTKIWLGLVLCVVVGCSACGRRADDPNTILLAVNAGVEADGLKAAAREYQKDHRVRVQVIEYPYQSLFEKLLISLSGRSSNYDLVMIDDPWFPRLAQMEGLLPLEAFFNEKGM